MNKRLEAIQTLVRPGKGLIDVGTDHGYLPLALAGCGYPGVLIAADIGEGPLNAARHNARAAGLEDRLRFQLCDGLALCDPDAVDTIVIAGMGGDTICGILDRAEWVLDGRYTLLLQPMTRAEVLRYWLTNNGFGITAERLVSDGGTIYALLEARYGLFTPLTDGELYTGAYALTGREALWRPFLADRLRRLEKGLAGLRMADREPGRRLLLEQVRQEWEEELRHADGTGDF